MLEPRHPTTEPVRPPGKPLAPVLHAAKWPPDDDDPAGAPPGAPGGGGPGDPGAPGAPGAPGDPGGLGAPPGGGLDLADDGNFKRGRFKPVAMLVGLVIAAGAGAAVFFGMQTQAKKLTPQEIVATKKNIFVLAKADQLPKWRELAKSEQSELVQEALMQLGYAEDPEGVALATAALERPDHNVRGVAAQVLAYYGSPRADGAKPSLLKVLKEANESDKPQITWALVTLKEPAVFEEAMKEYRAGNLSKVERLGGGAAFDPELISGLVSLDELAKLADDPSPSVRQLVATVLSRAAEPRFTQPLIKLVRDKDVEVARSAANGLGKIGDETATAPLLEALSNSDKESRQRFLEALRDGIGGPGLVLAFKSIKHDPEETHWFQTKQIMEMLREIADPRVGDALVSWVESAKPPTHWRAEVGVRLAEVGDVRAAKYLGERMLMDPLKLYTQQKFWEADEGGHLSRTDLPRVVAARMLADLAALHPEKAGELKDQAEDQVIRWITEKPQPHANGLRFLATVRSDKILPKLREWSFPSDPLPKVGAQPPFPTAFETAQSALRYIGRAKDEQSFPKLIEQFKRKKDKKTDITQAGLEGAGLAMYGMALRAVGYGAAQGLAEWGDPKAAKDLIELIEDETWHEEARQAACESLAFCADDKTMSEVVEKTREFASKNDQKKQLIGACYAMTLARKPQPSAVPALVDLLSAEVENSVRIVVAQAIGAAGLDAASEAKLFEKLKDVEIRNAAALALVLGGSAETAARTVAMYADFDKSALDDLKDHYFRSFGYWSDEDFKRKNLYRWVANAEAIRRIKVGDAAQEWARQRLQSQFDNLRFDNGPHSETRVVLRHRLFQAAKSQDAEHRKGAIMTLKFMKERGTLMALRQEPGETGALAKRAFHELMNPKAVEPESLEHLKQAGDKGGSTVNVRSPQ